MVACILVTQCHKGSSSHSLLASGDANELASMLESHCDLKDERQDFSAFPGFGFEPTAADEAPHLLVARGRHTELA